MVFSSIPFVFYFLPIFLVCYFAFGRSNWIILFGSAVFYVWGEGINIVLIVSLLAFNYWMGRLIGSDRERLAKVGIWVGVGVNLAVLGHYKYAQFLVANLTRLGVHSAAAYPLDPNHHLPLGISFFVFQMISYLVDVRAGKVQAERYPSRLATYMMMFPHLIAGPIVRYANIAGEIAARRVDVASVGLGVQYFIVGLCQKVLIANTVARFADHAFSVPVNQLDGLTAWLGAVTYTIQIYFDFCGYSNVAIGLALMMGFHFPRNFNYPYIARSVTEFWRRWHISLSTWFRDYVYIAIGGNRAGRFATVRNLLIVFFLTGLWHGAAWTFVLWGLYHGAFLLMERLGLGQVLDRMPRWIRNAYVLILVMFGWVLFRAGDRHQTFSYWKAMVFLSTPVKSPETPVPITLWLTPEVIAALIVGSVLACPVMAWGLDRLGYARLGRQAAIADPAMDIHYVHALPVGVLLAGLVVASALLAGDTLNPFLYFRF